MSLCICRRVLVLLVLLSIRLLPSTAPAGTDAFLAPVIERLLVVHEKTHDGTAYDLALGFAEILACGSPHAGCGMPPELQTACRRLAADLAGDGDIIHAWRVSGDRLLAELQRDMKLPAAVNRPLADPLRSRLRSGQLVVRYLFCGSRVLVFFLDRDHVGCREVAMDAAALISLVNRLSEPLEDFARGQIDYLRVPYDMDIASRLYNVLLRPLLESRPDVAELFVITDRHLAMLSFEALVTGFNNAALQPDVLFSEYRAADYLIDRCTISYFLSLTDLLRRFSPGSYRLQLAAFGHPLTGGVKKTRLRRAFVADIPSTAVEIDSLKQLLPAGGSRSFLGGACTPENFEHWAPQARLVHLATHFFLDLQDPGRSAFLFTPGVDGVSLYEARRLAAQRLRAELVVLSACESLECLLRRDRLGNGATAALRQAGARAMLATLWPVDEYNSQLVPLFYRRYLAGGDAAAALRGAKRELFTRVRRLNKRSSISFAHPFLWAAFVLVNFCAPD